MSYTSLVGSWYKTSTWASTYQGVINPEMDSNEIEIPAEVMERQLIPPHTKRPSGRPREMRIPSTVEFGKKKTWQVKVNRCSRCKRTRHNRVRCGNPI
ncbi:hypothetical protein V5N11_002997 [Cardamine amara subsp. amara]|uniref:Ribosomal protein L32 n=1 Tax=Cardamine amara subsp. amara TaxID=228776 RepID=A0ABD1AIS6_CARAN